jgi:hypothetical protein
MKNDRTTVDPTKGRHRPPTNFLHGGLYGWVTSAAKVLDETM